MNPKSLDRREVLRGMAGFGALTAGARSFARARPLKVGVIGGGIVGAIAMHLARAGATVTVFEKAGPALGATQNSFAWVNAFVADAHYRDLRLRSLFAYRELDKPLSLNLVWGGYLSWAANQAEAETVRASARQLAGTLYPVRNVLGPEFAALDPGVLPGNIAEAFYSTIDGHLDPVFVTRRFLDEAARAGAQVIYPCEVLSLETTGPHLRGVVTTHGAFPLDRLVVAAGVDAPRILSMVNYSLPLKHAPGILAHSASLPPLSRAVHDAPGGLSFKQMADGSVVGTDALDPPDIAAHHGIRDHAMAFPSEELRIYRILTKIAAFLPAAQGVALDRLTLGFRPVPQDEFPVVGSLPTLRDVHVAVMHSGVTLAAIMGRYTADEVLNASRIDGLSPYRPERFS